MSCWRTATLPSELAKEHSRNIKVRIGQPISTEVQQEQETLEDFADLLRRKTYMLANAYEKRASH